MNEEQERIEFDVPNAAKYAGYPINEIGYNVDLQRVYVIFEGDDLADGWDQLIFQAQQSSTGTVSIVGYPAGLMTPVDARKSDTEGGNEAEELYNLLDELGIRVYP